MTVKTNATTWQQGNRGKGVSLSTKETTVYILRATFCFLVFEVFCHYIYVSAMAKDGFYSTLHVTKYTVQRTTYTTAPPHLSALLYAGTLQY